MFTDNLLHNLTLKDASEREILSDVTYERNFSGNEYFMMYVKSGKANLIIDKTHYKASSGCFVLCGNTSLKYRFSKRHPARIFELSFKEIPDILPLGVYKCADKTPAENALSEITAEFITKEKYSEERLTLLSQNLFITLARSIEKESDRDKVLKALIKDIHQNFLSDKTDIESYAEKLDISKDRLSVIFKEKYGLPPYKYQLMLKMDYATDLLMHTDLSIGEISDKLGFQNQLYFSASYKKQVGVTPSEMRKHAVTPTSRSG